MADSSIFCETCHRIFEARGRNNVPLKSMQEENLHHSSASEFLRAVASKCFICYAVWNQASADFKAVYAHGWELTMTSRLYLPENEASSVRLVISQQSKMRPECHYMVFLLVHVKGVPIVFGLLLSWGSKCTSTELGRCNSISQSRLTGYSPRAAIPPRFKGHTS
jgi:hypothetical protein